MRKMMIAALAATMLSGAAQADLLVDRGLPTTNLNNAAGSDRSNIAWAGDPGEIIGDSFTLAGGVGTSYKITSLRTWVIARDGFPLSASLYTGSGANANLSLATFSTVTFSQKTYANGQGYQTTGGDFRRLYQVEFTGMNISALGGDTISFGVDGLNRGDYPFFNVASNAGLSGSQQDSADGVMSFYKVGSGGATYTGAFQSAGNGWDKSSDINVQVFGTTTTAVPEPATWAMMTLGFGAMGFAMRRKKVSTRIRFA